MNQTLNSQSYLNSMLKEKVCYEEYYKNIIFLKIIIL